MRSDTVGLSLTGLSKLLGVSHVAVVKAVKRGRLSKSIRFNSKGKPEVADVELAKQEWTQNSGRALLTAGALAPVTPPVTAVPPGAASLADAQKMAVEERARKLRLENDARERMLVPAEKVRLEAFEGARIIRDSLLNLPDRLAGELAADTDPAVVWKKLDAAIRQALDSAAASLVETVH